MADAGETGAKRQHPVQRWIRRVTLGSLALLIVAAAAFELWRQYQISDANRKLDAARVALDSHLKASPSFDQWLNEIASGTNGQSAFIEDFLAKCAKYGADLPANPVAGINWHGWTKPDEASEPASTQDLKTWLSATEPIAASLAGMRSFDRITIDPRHPAFEGMLSGKSVTVMLLYSLAQLQVPAQRVVALRHLGEIEQARSEFLVLLEVSRKVRHAASWIQVVYLATFDQNVRELAWRLAADDLLKPADMALLDDRVDYRQELANCCEGTLLWIRGAGPWAILADDAERGNDPDWFCWLNPLNYKKLSGDELARLTILYQHEIATFAEWIEYSQAWMNAARTGGSTPEAPELSGLIAAPLRWDEQLDALTPPSATAEWRSVVMETRRAAVAGQGAEKAKQLGATARYVEFRAQDGAVTIRFRHNPDTCSALHTSDNRPPMPAETEFYAEYPPVTLSLK